MFEEFFELHENPFSTNRVDYFYQNKSIENTISGLSARIYENAELTILLGDFGIGKTMLLQHLIERELLQQLTDIDSSWQKVIFYSERNKWPALIDFLFHEEDNLDFEVKKRALIEKLTNVHQENSIPVLIVDNAQSLKDDAIASLLQLTELQVEGRPLLQVILTAVPNFMSRFDNSILFAYKPSTFRQYKLNTFTADEVREYINFRLQQAGFKRKDLFTGAAIKEITKHTNGVPSLINKITGMALSIASMKGVKTIDKDVIDEASSECFFLPTSAESKEVSAFSTQTNNGRTNNDRLVINFTQWFSQYGTVVVAILMSFVVILVIQLIHLSPHSEKQKIDNLNVGLTAPKLIIDEDNYEGVNTNEDVNIVEQSLQEKSVIENQTIEQRGDIAQSTIQKEMVIPADPVVTEHNRPDLQILTSGLMKDNEQLEAESAYITDSSPEIEKLEEESKEVFTIEEEALQQSPSDEEPSEVFTIEETLQQSPPEEETPEVLTVEEETLSPFPSEQVRPDHQATLNRIEPRDEQSLPSSREIKLSKREQRAKDRAAARLELTLAGIEYEIEALFSAANNAEHRVLQLLVATGMPLDAQDQRDGSTALSLAAGKGHSEVVRFLLSSRASVNLLNFKKKSALMLAANNGHTETVKILLNNGANVNINDNNGWTALMFATSGNHFETVRALLKFGANVREENNLGSTALEIAKKNGYLEIVKILL